MCWRWVCRRLININKQLRTIVDTIEAGEGDLTLRVQHLCEDEIGTLASSINVFVETLQGIMGHINESSSQLEGIVGLVSDKVTTANDNSTDISSVMEEMSASMEEVSSTVVEIKGTVDAADTNMTQLADAAEDLHTYVGEMQQRAEELEKSADENKQNTSDVVDDIIHSLKKAIEESKSVEKVNSLTNEILGISSQTNLLALNASIEAARAGEAGRGFAVVADEISQLADSSRVAANNIQEINNMVVQAVNELIKSSDAMVNYITENILPDYDGFVAAGKQYNDDAEHVNEVVTAFNHKSAEVQHQMHSVAESMDNINEAVEESASGVSTAAMNTSELVKDINAIEHAMEDNKQVAGVLTKEAEQFAKL
jgi:methyl-accepting chemotaxis protein